LSAQFEGKLQEQINKTMLRIFFNSKSVVQHGRTLISVRNFGRKILCTDGVDKCCVDILESRGFSVTLSPTLPQAELIKVSLAFLRCISQWFYYLLW
jgi:hypothetical protein